MKNTLILGSVAVVLLVGAIMIPQQSPDSTTSFISESGIHWHPRIEILVDGQKIDMPKNIGVGTAYAGRPGYGMGGMAMTPIHTHDDVPVVHLEFSGKVASEDIVLGRFFEVWGKNLNEFGTDVRMTVNGIENQELNQYVMRDGDSITLEYN